jgi:hypothetical protein
VAVLGERHPDTLIARRVRTQILNSLERHLEALNELEELFAISASVRGVQHPDTLKALSLKEQILEKLKRQDIKV